MWSYWQGGKDHINAKILLVGQDWGDVKDAKEIIKRFNLDFNYKIQFLTIT